VCVETTFGLVKALTKTVFSATLEQQYTMRKVMYGTSDHTLMICPKRQRKAWQGESSQAQNHAIQIEIHRALPQKAKPRAWERVLDGHKTLESSLISTGIPPYEKLPWAQSRKHRSRRSQNTDGTLSRARFSNRYSLTNPEQPPCPPLSMQCTIPIGGYTASSHHLR
jgi:hypothetical protein